MKRIEITYISQSKEIIKLNEKLERAEKRLAKKTAAAEKLGVAEWTAEERNAWLKTVPTNEIGWITDEKATKMNGAWFELEMAKDEVEEIKEKIENALTRFEKTEKAVEDYREEEKRILDAKEKEELWKLEFEEEQKEWAKDGIILEDRYTGKTPKGKRFWIDRNNGWTKRSLHCFTLYIDGQVIFTSGEFWLAYAEIKNR